MTKIIGLDAGGTFTDAVIIDTDEYTIIRSSKSPTTRQNLSVGIGRAIRLALGIDKADNKEIP